VSDPTPQYRPITSTASNAMSEDELDEFLEAATVGMLATHNPNGTIHLTPIWFIWLERQLMFTMPVTRRHIQNLLRSADATVCVSEDLRPTLGWGARARAAVLRGSVALRGPFVPLSDESGSETAILKQCAAKYLGPAGDDFSQYSPETLAEQRLLAVLQPSRILSWDFAKA
jgi:nitroimidazol reductase NimA-like FMN-containing flavoprotein (pyridoxamine 5'-phosphate oxidase superfamily)